MKSKSKATATIKRAKMDAGSSIRDHHFLNYIRRIFNSIRRIFKQFIDFLPDNKLEYVVAALDQIGQTILKYPITVIFERIDLHDPFFYLIILSFVTQPPNSRI